MAWVGLRASAVGPVLGATSRGLRPSRDADMAAPSTSTDVFGMGCAVGRDPIAVIGPVPCTPKLSIGVGSNISVGDASRVLVLNAFADDETIETGLTSVLKRCVLSTAKYPYRRVALTSVTKVDFIS